MKRWIALLCIVPLFLLSACALQPTAAKSVPVGNTVNDNCGGSVTVYGGAASAANPLIGNGYCTAVISHDDADAFGKSLVVHGSDKSDRYAILYITRSDKSWHYDARLVFVGPTEQQVSSLGALNPGKDWMAEFIFVFVPGNNAAPMLTSELAAAIVGRIAPVDSVHAFKDVSIPSAQSCAALSDVLSPK